MTITVIINFFKGYLRGFKRQKYKLNTIYYNIALAATGIYLIQLYKLSSLQRIRTPSTLLLRRPVISLRHSQALKTIRLRSFLLKGLKKGRLASLPIVRLVLQERYITSLYIFEALTPTITPSSRSLFELFLQIIIYGRTRGII